MGNQWTRRALLGAAGVAAVTQVARAADGGKAPKIVGIACSFRAGKTTTAATRAALDSAKQAFPAIETELIDLAGLQINGAVAAGISLPDGQRDDFPAIAEKLRDPAVAGIILASPVYFGNMSSLCKAFLERCIVFRGSFGLRNKVAGCIAVGGSRNGGQEMTLQSMRAALAAQDIIVVGDGKPTSHLGGTLWPTDGDIEKDQWGMETVKNLGKRVAELAIKMA